MIASLTVAMLGVFVIRVSASTEYEWTSNSSLIKDEGKWNCSLWHWNGGLDPAEPDDNNYCNWAADGTVNSRVQDAHDGYYTAANLDQGTERSSLPASYQPPLIRLTDCDKVTLEADVENCHASYYVEPFNFVGIKFDVWAVVNQQDGSLKLMTEMYFLRAGLNLAWIKEYARQTKNGSDVWNYLVALDHPDFYGKYANETKYGEDSARWSIDLKYFIERGVNGCNERRNATLEFDKLYLAKVSFTCEAGATFSIGCPACWGTIHKLKVTSSGSPKQLSIFTRLGGSGTTDPVSGTYTYDYGEVVTVTATAGSGSMFNYWWLPEPVNGTYLLVFDNPITITMTSNYTLEACFTSTTGGGGGGCPTLFVWNGTAYVEEGLLDIHAESDVTIHHIIQNILALENDVYSLQLRELDNNTSHIDQVKLYAVDYEGEWRLCPLTYAYHNLLGKVKHTLRFDDENRVDLEPTETIDLQFALSTSYGETAYFIFEINGYNPKNPTHT
jgi:hypothetical protein